MRKNEETVIEQKIWTLTRNEIPIIIPIAYVHTFLLNFSVLIILYKQLSEINAILSQISGTVHIAYTILYNTDRMCSEY